MDDAGHFTDEGKEYDQKRTEFLNSVGIRVIRFENLEVFNYPGQVLEEIKMNLND